MKFFRNNWYWILGIVIGLGIGSIITMHRVQQQTATTGPITPDIAGQKPDMSSPPPLGETAESGFWHGDHWHKTSPVALVKRKSPTVVQKTKRSISKTAADLPILKQWKHHPHQSDYDHRSPSDIMSELGIPQGKIDRIYQIGEEMSIVPNVDNLEVWILGKRQEVINVLTEGLDTESAFKVLKSFPLGSFFRERAREYAQRAVNENPDFLEGRLYLVYRGPDDARSAAEFREILRDFPDSIGALTGLGLNLAMDHPVEAIYHLKYANSMNPSAGLAALGKAYQRLGDYKTAWVYLKKAQTYPHGPILDDYIEAIESGIPMIQPILQLNVKSPAYNDTSPQGKDALPQDTSTTTKMLQGDKVLSDESIRPLPSEQKTADIDRERAAAAAKQAHEEFLKHREFAQKEFNEFLQWAETIINAESPLDTNNFLMKEMETFLKGGKSHFEPDRIVRAFEIMERYGPKAGIKHLQSKDPEFVKQVQRLLIEKRPPHQKK